MCGCVAGAGFTGGGLLACVVAVTGAGAVERVVVGIGRGVALVGVTGAGAGVLATVVWVAVPSAVADGLRRATRWVVLCVAGLVAVEVVVAVAGVTGAWVVWEEFELEEEPQPAAAIASAPAASDMRMG